MLDRFDPRWDDARTREPEGLDRNRKCPSTTALGARLRHVEVFADLLREVVVDLAVAGNGRGSSSGAIHVDGVVGTLAEQLAAVGLQVAHQVGALHADSLSGSRMTSGPPRSSWASARLASSTRRTASSRFTRASANVAP